MFTNKKKKLNIYIYVVYGCNVVNQSLVYGSRLAPIIRLYSF